MATVTMAARSQVSADSAERLTHPTAAELLGVHVGTVTRMVARVELGPVQKWAKASLSRVRVERLSLERWRPGHLTWLTVGQVAQLLGVSEPRVRQLADAGRLPCERNSAGKRLFRPGQIEVVARARRQRFPRGGNEGLEFRVQSAGAS